MKSSTRAMALCLAVAAFGGASWWWWSTKAPHPAPAAVAPAVAEMPASAPPMPAPASAAVSGQPVEAPVAKGSRIEEADIGAALASLVGGKAARTFLRTDDFAHRFVATVDNLGRSHAPASMWPVNATEGRFTIETRGEESFIAADNGLRYSAFVLFVESVPVGGAVDLYARMYPALQRAYEELGYPGRSFNARLIEVIDRLLETPEAPYPVGVRLTEVRGPIPSTRPWVRYEFADPALEELSAGQKVLVRAGSVNARRLKAKLAAIRSELVGRAGR